VNAGAFRALEVVIPEGNIMMAKFPAPMSGWSLPIPTVVDTIVAALAPAIPDKVPAAHLGVLGGTIIFTGLHPETGQKFIVQSIEGGGWGGRPHEDGASASVSVCQGDVRNVPVEIQEARYPLLFTRHEIRQDSGGAGMHRGGFGLDTEVVPQQRVYSNVANERTTCPPWGLNRGLSGAVNDTIVKRPNKPNEQIHKQTGLPLDRGDSILFRTAGGGGWGAPLLRAPDEVLADVLDGFVSIGAATELYGVVVTVSGGIDYEATVKLRSERSSVNAV